MNAVSIITQTRLREDCDEAFARFQIKANIIVSTQAGFIEQMTLPPKPPSQVDWVVVQRFSSDTAATAWLRSEDRHALFSEVQPLLCGHDDVHLIRDSAAGALPSPVSAVISTRVKPGFEPEYRAWERRIAAVQARFPGFQGYRLEPPIPGVQDNYVAIIRFENDTALQSFMHSPDVKRLLAESEGLTEQVSARIVNSGFGQWFPPAAQGGPAWKANMVVLLLLYPFVFLFNIWVGGPILTHDLYLPFWLSLFCTNVLGVFTLNFAVPPLVKRFMWWLNPAKNDWRIDVAGAALIISLYLVLFSIFSHL